MQLKQWIEHNLHHDQSKRYYNQHYTKRSTQQSEQQKHRGFTQMNLDKIQIQIHVAHEHIIKFNT